MSRQRWLRSLGLLCLALVATIVLHTGGTVAQPGDDLGNTAVSSLTQQATQFYDRGDYSQASQLWRQAIAAYAEDNDSLNQAMASSNLSLTYQQLFQLSEAEQAITTSLDLLRYNPKTPNISASADPHYLAILAPSLDIRGRLYWQQGNPQTALTTWQQTAQIYRILGNVQAEVQSQLNQVQAFQALGNLTAAHKQLQQVEVMLAQQPSSPLKVEQLRSLGNTHRLMGNLKQAEDALSQALTIASVSEQPVMQMELGNLQWAIANRARQINTKPKREKAIAKTQQALQHYTQASQSPQLRLQAHLNQLGLLLDAGDYAAADVLWQTLKGTMAELPSDRPSLLARLTYAQYLTCLKQRDKKTVPLCSQTAPSPTATAAPKQLLAIDSLDWVTIAQLLTTSAKQAKTLGDIHTQSYALGTLGTLYELIAQADHAINLTYAIDLTNQALILAQAHQARDLAYRWLWQRGRLLKRQGDRPGSIIAYKAAVETLDPVRANLLPAAADVQFDFRDNVEPLYRELVDLLLQPEADGQVPQENLKAAIDYIDALQLAEIEDHLRCNLAQRVKLNEGQTQDPHAAIIYSIILEDRLATIVRLPELPLFLQTTRIQQKETERILTSLTNAILSQNRPEVVIEDASTVYQWLVEPAEKNILEGKADIRTLVFVGDGLLRTIPPAVLYDEQQKQYLVEKEQYALAIAPSLQLVNHQSLSRQGLRVLKAGLSEKPTIPGRPDIAAIPYVQNELDNTDAIVPGQRLLNTTFTKATFQQRVTQTAFDLVHLATHGQFSSDPEETFILAHDGEIYGTELDQLLRTATDRNLDIFKLLILSACQTARGDNRATLGLAGITLRSGASSTLATLWQVNDAATAAVIKQFYQEMIKPDVSLAEALHHAQLTLVKTVEYRNNPYIWAPFILVGNWL